MLKALSKVGFRLRRQVGSHMILKEGIQMERGWGLDASFAYLHEIPLSKYPLVHDFQELFRHVVDYSVILILESGIKKSDFITTENYHIRLKPNTATRSIRSKRQTVTFRNCSMNITIPTSRSTAWSPLTHR